MPYEVHSAPGEQVPTLETSGDPSSWPMWEVFVRQRRGLSHVHAGSLHAPDAETAIQNARDVYTRRAPNPKPQTPNIKLNLLNK